MSYKLCACHNFSVLIKKHSAELFGRAGKRPKKTGAFNGYAYVISALFLSDLKVFLCNANDSPEFI